MKHKITFIKEGDFVFMFQSGVIGNKRSHNSRYDDPIFEYNGISIQSVSEPDFWSDVIYIQGIDIERDFRVIKQRLDEGQFDKLKEVEHAYNNRNSDD